MDAYELSMVHVHAHEIHLTPYKIFLSADLIQGKKTNSQKDTWWQRKQGLGRS